MDHGSNAPRRHSALVLAGLAGLVAPLAGCSSLFGTRADVVDPMTGGPVVTEPATTTTSAPVPVARRSPVNEVNPAEPTPAEPTYIAGANAGNARPNTSSDGWLMVASAGDAERAATPAPEFAGPVTNRPDGPNMAARLYGEILGTNIPATGDAIGQHTTNIQQISFANDGSDFDPMVSRDGSTLIYASTQHRPEADIYIQEIGSKVITRVTEDPAGDVMPALNADADRLAFASNRTGNWDIWIMPSTGGRAIQITNDPAHELHPSFSPDGRHVVYCRLGSTSGRWEIWVQDSFGDSGAQFIGYGLFPEWSPVAGTGNDGADRILFQRSRERGSRTFSIWTIDYDRDRRQAGRETQIASDPNAALINPTWSPDGTRITFAAVPNPEEWTGSGGSALPPSASIWMIGIDGRGAVTLTSGSAIDMMPAWGATGRIFFVSDRSGVENLWSLDIAPAILAATGVDPWDTFAAQRRNQVEELNGQPVYVSAPTDQP
jgi:TolB protein